MKPIVIYGLYDPRNGELRYIGKTAKNRLTRRLWEHRSEAALKETNPRNCWLRKLLRLGLNPECAIIEETTEGLWQERERFWIAYHRNAGARLTNTTEGGEGGATCTGQKWTDERRKYISDKFKGHRVSDKTLSALKQNHARGPRVNHGRRIKFNDNALRAMYVNQGLSSKEIAKHFGVTDKPIRRRLRELGLLRSKAEAAQHRERRINAKHGMAAVSLHIGIARMRQAYSH